MNAISKIPLAPGVAIHRNTAVLHDLPQRRKHSTPAEILHANFGRRPLRCDQGPVTRDLGLSQIYAAQTRR